MVKNPPASAGDAGSVPGSGRSPREGSGYPRQYSHLGSPMERETRQGYSPWGRTQLSDQTTVKWCKLSFVHLF